MHAPLATIWSCIHLSRGRHIHCFIIELTHTPLSIHLGTRGQWRIFTGANLGRGPPNEIAKFLLLHLILRWLQPKSQSNGPQISETRRPSPRFFCLCWLVSQYRLISWTGCNGQRHNGRWAAAVASGLDIRWRWGSSRPCPGPDPRGQLRQVADVMRGAGEQQPNWVPGVAASDLSSD
jgi:hypothetical protein